MSLLKFVCAFSLLFITVGAVRPQDTVIRVDTDLVLVSVSVLDRQGRFLLDTDRSKFSIFENSRKQEIAYFETTEKPFTVLLLIDNSGSMNDYLPQLNGAIATFIAQLRQDDTVIVASFSDQKQFDSVLGPMKKEDLRRNIRLSERTGDSFTATFDAVERGIELLGKIDGRKALILFSDGELFGRDASARSNLRDAEEQDALIYTIRFGEYPNYQQGIREREYDRRDSIWDKNAGMIGEGRSIITEDDLAATGASKKQKTKKIAELKKKVNNYMQGLAAKTGGQSFEVDKIENLVGTFELIASEISRQYTLGYYPSEPGKDGERRQIRITVDVPNAAVRSRSEVVYKKK